MSDSRAFRKLVSDDRQTEFWTWKLKTQNWMVGIHQGPVWANATYAYDAL